MRVQRVSARKRSRLNRARSATQRATVILGDLQALNTGKVAQRVGNRVLGRAVGKAMRGVWFR